jgi:hypothetical protein
MKKVNECDMFVSLKVDNQDVYLSVTSVPNCKESFILNMDQYLEDLTIDDDLIIWESIILNKFTIVNEIKDKNYKLNKLVICNERYTDFREEKK